MTTDSRHGQHQDTAADPEPTREVSSGDGSLLPGVTTEPQWPRRVDAWMTSDGCLHDNEYAAELRQQDLDGARMATAMLERGVSLGEALRAGGFLSHGSYPELYEVTKDTKLIISHWQCRDEPGYRPRSIDREGEIFVWGDAGSWSGPYGGRCTARDVAGYWNNTKKRTHGARP